ncbi:MAG: hypothetical protein HFI90_03915 [Clostridia bacterium]|nr:hypothetical protein [Clostridia bacterium]
MSILQLIGIALITAILCVTVKQFKPEFSLPLLLVGSAALLLGLAPQIASMIEAVQRMAQNCGIDNKYIQIVIKTTGIACLCSIAASMCRDAGQSALGSKIELGGRLTILVLAMPVVSELYYVILQCIR